MDCKSLIALLLVAPQNFSERLTGGLSRMNEDPRALGATPAPKTLLFDPYELAAHALVAPGLAA